MKVLEVKNNLVKIQYEKENNLLLSGFVIIEDTNSPYVAQVLSLKADNDIKYAIVKLLFTFDNDGIVKNYNGTIPSLDADVSMLSSNELLDILPVTTPVKMGLLAHEKINLNVDLSVFEKNLLICSDNIKNTNLLIENFKNQLADLNCKSVVFDIDGTLNGKKLVFGKDFKLPLNYETINYIYEHDLNNVEATSKAVIQDILLEVQEYSKTVLDKFIPFDTFIDVVDKQYKATQIPELALLKNKLLSYKEAEVFAQSPKEIQSLRSAIRAELTCVIDISGADEVLQSEIIKYTYNTIDEMDLFVYSFVQLTNSNADKKIIRHFINKNKIYTSIVCSHNFKYLYELKERAGNLILFAPQTLQHDFASYNTFLNKLSSEEFIIYGMATQNIPLIVELAAAEGTDNPQETESISSQNDIAQTADIITQETEETLPQQDDFSEESNSYSYETLIDDTTQSPEVEEETPASAPEQETNEQTDPIQETPESAVEQEIQEPMTISEENAPEENLELPDDILNTEEIIQVPNIFAQDFEQEIDVDTDAISNIIDEEIENESQNDEISYDAKTLNPEITEEVQPETENASIEDKVAQDVDELIYSNEKQEVPSIDDIIEEESNVNNPEEDLTEDDLNFIQDINSPVEETELPVYPANEEIVQVNPQTFAAGDEVSHPKYGKGVVEKMIRYGNKSLCSISFVNVGRRLLDPSISEITKLK